MSLVARHYKLLRSFLFNFNFCSSTTLPNKTLEHILHKLVSYGYKTGHFVTPKYYRYENLLLEVLIWINGAGFWRPSVSGLLTFLQNISPSSCFFSFANHLISNIRCDKDNSGMPMFISPMLRCTFVSFTRWALTSRPDKVFISHPAPTQPLHISTFAPTVNLGSSNQNNVFL